jgi:hypothetical protein
MALLKDSGLSDDPFPESATVHQRDAEVRTSMTRAAMGLGAALGTGLLLWKLGKHH